MINRRKLIVQNLSQMALLAAIAQYPQRLFASSSISQSQLSTQGLIIFIIDGGFDASHFFDARPLSFTKHQKLVNIADTEPTPLAGSNGQSCLVSQFAKPLLKHKELFSVVNGIIMDKNTDGHDQSLNYLLTKNPAGDDCFTQKISAIENQSLFDLLIMSNGSLSPNIKTLKSEIRYRDGDDFINAMNALKEFRLDLNSRGSKILLDLYKNYSGTGQFSVGVQKIRNSILNVEAIKANFTKMYDEYGLTNSKAYRSDDNQPKILTNIEAAIESARLTFASLLTNVAVIDITAFVEQNEDFRFDFDMHSPDDYTAKQFTAVSDQIDRAINYMKKTQFKKGGNSSILENINVMITSEFSRTMRQARRKSISESGTDHNSLNNSALVFGKDIKGGQVFGASDLNEISDSGDFLNVSNAHKSVDYQLIKMIGKGFDFSNDRVIEKQFDNFSSKNRLNMINVINTLMYAMGVPKKDLWTLGSATSPVEAPIIASLLKS